MRDSFTASCFLNDALNLHSHTNDLANVKKVNK